MARAVRGSRSFDTGSWELPEEQATFAPMGDGLAGERLRDNVLPGAEETFELSKTAVEAGESNYLTLLTAQRTLVNTRLRILDALGEARRAAAEIDGLLVTLP